MNIEFFDTHCHIDDECFNEDRNKVLRRMTEMNVAYAAVVGSDIATSHSAVRFAEDHDNFYAVVGIHPHEAKHFVNKDIHTLSNMIACDKVVAIGEIGLDYYYDHSLRSEQKNVCEKLVQFAFEKKIPVVYHIRDAHNDMISIMKAQNGALSGGIIHCFSGSKEQAKIYLDLGYYISFAGPVTFKKAPKLIDVARYVPLDRLLIETDSPYLSPEPKRGRRNEPGYVRYVAEKLADTKCVSLEKFAQMTTENAKRVYQIR